MADAASLLRSLEGRAIRTATGRENRILRVEGDHALVQTSRSPGGQRVPIAWVEDALDRFVRDGEIEISVESLGYRSAFVGAVLLEVPGAVLIAGASPPRLRLTQT